MKKPKSIHFVGIKGVGVAPLAIIAKEAGIQVSGSDIADEFITDAPLHAVGITPLTGFSKDHVKDVDLVITTGAHGGFENEEVKAAKEKGIPILTQGQAVGEFMQGEILGRSLIGISVTGSHGKTTTTALLATVLSENKMDPSYVIGTGTIPSLGNPGHFGRGKYFIAEADEYASEPVFDKTPKFLFQYPQFAIFTNIELDHPDLFPTIDSIRDAFLRFTENISKNGALIANGDDRQIQKMLQGYSGRVITYGTHDSNDFVLKKVHESLNQTFFWVESNKLTLGEFAIKIPGEHNAMNALAVIAVCLELGLTLENIKKGLLGFSGTKRRFEYIGTTENGAILFDDYAHHPTEIKKTLTAFRKRFPTYQLVCIFQPHTYSRTKALFTDFAHSFYDVDEVILTDIYPSLREEKDESVSSKMLATEVSKFRKNAQYISDLVSVIKYINEKKYKENSIIITMGAGDVYTIGQKLKVKS